MAKSLPPIQKIFCHLCGTFVAEVVGITIDADNIRGGDFSLQFNCPSRDCPSRQGPKDAKRALVCTVELNPEALKEENHAKTVPSDLEAIAITMTRKEWTALVTAIRKHDQLQLGRLPWMAIGTIEGHI